jgi:uncharacterized protein with PCYCGC motif
VRGGVLVAAAVALALAGVAQSAPTVAQRAPAKDEIGDEVQTVPRGGLPAFAADADAPALYRFATSRGDVLRYMPCTCGCAQVGHTSNRSCYIKAEHDAAVTYTSHAAT